LASFLLLLFRSGVLGLNLFLKICALLIELRDLCGHVSLARLPRFLALLDEGNDLLDIGLSFCARGQLLLELRLLRVELSVPLVEKLDLLLERLVVLAGLLGRLLELLVFGPVVFEDLDHLDLLGLLDDDLFLIGLYLLCQFFSLARNLRVQLTSDVALLAALLLELRGHNTHLLLGLLLQLLVLLLELFRVLGDVRVFLS